MSAPGWVAPGREVVVISGRNYTPSPVLTIDRVLKRDVVLSNGDRWSMARLPPNADRITKSSADVWGPSTALFPADHPQVAEYRLAEVRRSVASACLTLTHQVEDAVRRGDWDEARLLHRGLGGWLRGAPDAPEPIAEATA